MVVPGSLPQPSQWSALTPERDEFRRVGFVATYHSGSDAMVYSSAPLCAKIFPVPAPGLFMPARLPTGETVAINTGFVQNTMQDRAQQDRAVTPLITNEPVMLTGYIRFPEAAGTLTPPENLAKRLWFTRDHLAMARALGWGEGGQKIAPFYIDLEAPVPSSGIPKPGPLEVHLKDDHPRISSCPSVTVTGWMYERTVAMPPNSHALVSREQGTGGGDDFWCRRPHRRLRILDPHHRRNL